MNFAFTVCVVREMPLFQLAQGGTQIDTQPTFTGKACYMAMGEFVFRT
jgi:hypothetical protein